MTLKQHKVSTTPSVTELVAFSLPDLTGQMQNSQQWQGKIRLINFWATWCPPCRQEIPELNRLQQAQSEKNLVVLGIAIDNESDVAAFIKTSAITYPVLLAPNQGMALSQQMGNLLGVIPFSVLVDEQNIMRHVWTGEVTQHDVEQELQALMLPTNNSTK
ncbi:hypothetical protein VZ94_17595 [Methylocucumis oryzae]|uniref:Thioredoxin domain-containing protein n=1 Tax=Methylocucumis oryzae TaxID=1632867 RepID=A0A0F3IFP2_9GAMM|nr:hypothetical protein VZ94_17595 [Methylocucumis oryzae]